MLDEIGGRIRKAFLEGRRNEVMYHVGRPGHERTMDRVLKAWGIDGHNSHTNVCSSSARLGYALWSGYDRPSPDHANARFILLLSSHLESGHYFNPHAQRIIDGKLAGAKLAVMDPRLSNTASMADYWLPTYPGSEAAVLLAMANVILDEGLADLAYVERWTNWREFMAAVSRGAEPTFAGFMAALREHYAEFTPEFAEAESGVARQTDRRGGAARRRRPGRLRLARLARDGQRQPGRLAGGARAAAPDRPHRERRARRAAPRPHAWNKYKPAFWEEPPPQKDWNELLFPREWPLSHYEMSLPAAAFPEGGPRQARHVLHARLQPGLDEPRRPHVDGGAAGRGAGRPPRRAHADLERDRHLRRLRAAHGPRAASVTTSRARRRIRAAG